MSAMTVDLRFSSGDSPGHDIRSYPQRLTSCKKSAPVAEIQSLAYPLLTYKEKGLSYSELSP